MARSMPIDSRESPDGSIVKSDWQQSPVDGGSVTQNQNGDEANSRARACTRRGANNMEVKTVKNNKGKAYLSGGHIVGLIFVMGLLVIGGIAFLGGGLEFAAMGGEAEDGLETAVESGTLITEEKTASTTLNIDAYTGDWGLAGSESEIWPGMTIVRNDDDKIVTDANANSTTRVNLHDTVDIYPTGHNYTFDPIMDEGIDTTQHDVKIEAYDIPLVSEMAITVADSDDNALTADDNANNTADYAGGNIGAGEDTQYIAKFKTNKKDKSFRIGAVLTYYCGGEADDFELVGTYDTHGGVDSVNWVPASLPPGKLTDTFSNYDDTNASTSCSWKRAYVPDGVDFVQLDEFEWIKLEYSFDSDDSTQPSANGDTYIGSAIVDYSCEIAENGDTICDWYKHDTNGDPGDVGNDEQVETQGFNGLEVGFTVEPQ